MSELPATPPSSYAIGAATDQGKVRDHNEDFHIVDPGGDARPYELLVLCDGMGGSARGEVASEIASQSIQRRVHESHEEGSEGGPLLEGEGRLSLAHVGDSRAYLALENGRFERLTRDHSWAEELYRANALKSEEEVRNHHQRHILTRFLGGREANKVEVDVTERQMDPGDRLMICSDGLWDMVRDPRIHEILIAQPPQEAATALVAEANLQGGRDNITVVIVERTA